MSNAALDLSYSKSTLHNAAGGLTTSWRNRALADTNDPHVRSARERDAQLRQTLDRLARAKDSGADAAKLNRLAQVADKLTKGLEQDRALQIRAQQQRLTEEMDRRRERARSDQLQAQTLGRLEAQFAALGRELTNLNKRQTQDFRQSRSFGAAGAVADKYGFSDVFKAITTERSKMVKELGTSSRMMALAQVAADRKGFAGVFDAVFKKAEASAEVAADGAIKVARKAAKAAEEIKEVVGDGDGLGAGTFKATVVEFDGSVKTFTQTVKAMEHHTSNERYLSQVRDRQGRHAERNTRLRDASHLRLIQGGLGPGGQGKKPGFMSQVVSQAATNVLTDLIGSVAGNALGFGGAAGLGGAAAGALRGGRGARAPHAPRIRVGGRWGRLLSFGAQAAGIGAAGAGAAALSADVLPFTPSTPSAPGAGSSPSANKAAEVARETAADAATIAKGGKGPRVRIASAAARTAGKALKSILGPTALALEVLDGWNQLQDLYGMYKTGEITEDEYKQEFGAVVGSMLGGAAGAAALAKIGAIAGGVIGGPVGAAVGAVAGGVVGGIAGSSYGADIGRWVASQTTGGSAAGQGGGGPAGASTPSQSYTAPDKSAGPTGRAGTTTDYSSHSGKGGIAGSGERGERMKGVYDAFRQAGFPHAAAKSFAAEIGRENDFNPNIMFGTHTDPKNGARNGGMMSWQGSRFNALYKRLGEQGLLNEDGSIKRNQEALNAMAGFAKEEMLDGKTLKNGKRAYDVLMSPNSSHADHAVALGDDVIKWARKDPRYAHHARKRDQYYDQFGKMTDGTAASNDNVTPSVRGDGKLGGEVDERQNSAEHRKQAITPELKAQLAKAGLDVGVSAEVYSGGQDEHGPNRTGSHRHDHGKSADIKLYETGPDGKRRYLSMNNPADRAKMEGFIRGSVRHGATGVGAANDYMGEHGIHIGGGPVGAWGAEGRSANAPDWVRRALQDGLADRKDPSRFQASSVIAKATQAIGAVGSVLSKAFGVSPAEGAELIRPGLPGRSGLATPNVDGLLTGPHLIDRSTPNGRRIGAELDKVTAERKAANDMVFGSATGRSSGFSKSWQGLPTDKFTGGKGFQVPDYGPQVPANQRFRMTGGEMGYTGAQSDLLPKFGRNAFGTGPALTKRLMDGTSVSRADFNGRWNAGQSGFTATPSFAKIGLGEGWSGPDSMLGPKFSRGQFGAMSGPSDQSGAVRQELMQAQAKAVEPPPSPPAPPPVLVPVPASKDPNGEKHDRKKMLKKDEYSALLGVMNSAMFNKGVA